MANKVPLFHQKVQESTGKMTSTAGVAPSASQAPHHDFSGFGRGLKKVAGIIGKIQKGREELKHEADLSDYEVSHDELLYNIEEWKQEAQKGDNPIPYNELEKEIVEPAWTDFGSQIDEKGYSDGAKRKIMERFQEDRRASLKKEQLERLNIEDKNNALKIRRHMEMELQPGGNEDEANRLFNILASNEGTEVAAEYRSRAIESVLKGDVYRNPLRALEEIDSGKYKYISEDAKKSARSYAKVLLNERQQKAMDEFYKPNSDYSGMTPENKQITINEAHERGEISSKAWKVETERLKNPKLSDIKPEDNQTYLDLQTELFASAGNQKKQTQILDKITASGMPMSMRTQLYQLQRDLASPTGKTKTASYTYARETMTAVFARSDVVDEVPVFKFWEKPEGFTKESREDLLFRAHAEAESELFEWMRATPDFDEAKINSKVYDIVSQKTKEYGLSQIPLRLEEQDLEDVLFVESVPEEAVDTQESAGEQVTDEDLINEILGGKQ